MVRPTSSKVRNVELQARAAEQVKRAIQSPEFPGKVVAEIHGELIVEVPKKDVDRAREFIAGIQAKDEGYRQRIQDSWMVCEGPQYAHVTCGQFAVIVRIRQASWVRDQKELYCTHCKVVPHELHVDFESQNSGT